MQLGLLAHLRRQSEVRTFFLSLFNFNGLITFDKVLFFNRIFNEKFIIQILHLSFLLTNFTYFFMEIKIFIFIKFRSVVQYRGYCKLLCGEELLERLLLGHLWSDHVSTHGNLVSR